MFNNSLIKKTLLAVSVVFLYSCDKDYNSIGDGLIGDNNFGFEKTTSNVVAYNQKITPVQSNNLPVNALGIYETEEFGTLTANFATQLTLDSPNPTLGVNPVIESVVLTIPYFSHLTATATDGSRTFELDSVYQASGSKIKLSVYESGYFMRSLDPASNFKEAQKYYTNQNSDFDNVKVGTRLNNSSSEDQNDAFEFSAAEYVDKDDDGVVLSRVDPAMRLDLSVEFFKTKIMDAIASGKLVSDDVFREYFRGLYFKAEKSGSNSAGLAMLDFAKGKITINYKEDTSTTDATRLDKTIVLNMTGNTVSLLEESNSKAAYTSATAEANVNKLVGDDKLYLKGGEGSMAIIELFGKDLYGEDGKTGAPNGVADELDVIRKSGWLINEANLIFHVDGTNADANKVNRVYVYDLNNSRSIVDYFDNSTGTTTKNGKLIFGGILNKTTDTDNYYKVRITNQIRNLVKNSDSTNVKLGVVVTEDVNIATSSKLKTATATISQVATASVMSPQGVVLYGSSPAVDDKKRLKLEIYYTKSN